MYHSKILTVNSLQQRQCLFNRQPGYTELSIAGVSPFLLKAIIVVTFLLF